MDELLGWARAAVDGDPVAVEELVRATQQDVRRLCSYLVDSASADDLTQDTYLRALRALPSFEGRAPLRVWLLGIARRACADELRRRTRRRGLLARLQAQPQQAAVGDGSGVVSSEDLLSRLDSDRRAAFVLTQLMGLSYAETAELLGVPIGTVRSRVARARTDLQDALRDRRLA